MLVSRIGFWIKHKGISREVICREMEVSQNTLSTWCTGKNFPSVPKAFKLAKLLGVTLNDLWEDIEETQKAPLE